MGLARARHTLPGGRLVAAWARLARGAWLMNRYSAACKACEILNQHDGNKINDFFILTIQERFA
jgi:hypothetical protein